MSLSDKLTQAVDEASVLVCKVGALLINTKLSAKEKEQLASILAMPDDHPARVSNAALSQILREEGYDISKSSIDRHRGARCTCHRKVSK
jgi:hypothetical protein